MLKPQFRPSARGVCFWYQGVRNARARASCRYRIGNFVELTCGADVILAEELPRAVAMRSHTIVCIRPRLTPPVARTLDELRRAGKWLVADYDDLLFAGDVSGLPASVRGLSDTNEIRERLTQYAAALEAFDAFVVATRPLAARLLECRPGARVNVVPNGLSRSWLEQGRALYPRFGSGDHLVIRYFAGSPSHNHDLASVVRPLGEFMRRHPQVALETLGPVELATVDLPAERVRSRRRVDYDRLPEALGTTWINLAPLAPTEFNRYKSALKFLESAAFGCPTLASKNDDLLRHQELGANVVPCDTEQDWYRELNAMLQPDRRSESGLAAMGYVNEHGMAETHTATWLRAITASEGNR